MDTDPKHAIIGAIAAIVAAIIIGLFGLFQGKYSYDAEPVVHPSRLTSEDKTKRDNPQDTVIEKDRQSKYIGFYSEQHQPETIYLWNSVKYDSKRTGMEF